MWSLRSRFSRNLGYDTTLFFHYIFQQFCIRIRSHRRITVTTHRNGHHFFFTPHALYTFTEKAVDTIFVCLIVPGSIHFTIASILLMVTRHRLMVGSTDYDPHLISQWTVHGIIRIESSTPHSRP